VGEEAEKVAETRAIGIDADAEQAGRQIIEAMQETGWLPKGDAAQWRRVLRSETGELTIDSGRDVLVLDTPNTAGGYAPQGETVATAAVRIRIDETDATVWVSSMDGKPIGESGRLILCHLTDLQNSGAMFAEQARKTLYYWGDLPHLVRAGSATVRITMSSASRAAVYALSTSGKRLHSVESAVDGGELIIKPNVLGPDGKARLVYEVVVP
jgi:hypothetical protein